MTPEVRWITPRGYTEPIPAWQDKSGKWLVAKMPHLAPAGTVTHELIEAAAPAPTDRAEKLSELLRGMARRARRYDQIGERIARMADEQIARLRTELAQCELHSPGAAGPQPGRVAAVARGRTRDSTGHPHEVGR